MTHLKELRLARNLTQTQVARDINISKQCYSYYELDKRQADYDTLLKLAKYFDTTVDYLISDKSTNSKKFSYPFNDDGELYTLLSGLSESEVNDLKLFVYYLYYLRSNES